MAELDNTSIHILMTSRTHGYELIGWGCQMVGGGGGGGALHVSTCSFFLQLHVTNSIYFLVSAHM